MKPAISRAVPTENPPENGVLVLVLVLFFCCRSPAHIQLTNAITKNSDLHELVARVKDMAVFVCGAPLREKRALVCAGWESEFRVRPGGLMQSDECTAGKKSNIFLQVTSPSDKQLKPSRASPSSTALRLPCEPRKIFVRKSSVCVCRLSTETVILYPSQTSSVQRP